MKRFPIAQYWPAALFTVSYVAAVALVIQANRSYGDDQPAPRTERQDESWRTADEDPFARLDAVDPEQTGGSHVPLLLNDFGEQFDTDFRTQRERRGLMALVGRVTDAVDVFREKALHQRRLEQRAEREAETGGRRLGISWWDSERPSRFLGSSDLVLPPELGDLPPLASSGSWSIDGASVYAASPRRLDIRVDPELFRDEAAMAEFIAKLRLALVMQGLEPEFRVADDTGGTAPAGSRVIAQAPPTAPARPPSLPVVRAETAPTQIRRAPAEVLRGVPEPEFNPDLVPGDGSVVLAPPRSAANAAEPPPIRPSASPQPLGPPPPDVRRPEPEPPKPPTRVVLAGSDEGPEPPARPAQPAEDGPVAIRIRLASFPSQAAADRALGQLREAGIEGSKYKTTDGLDFWIVHTRVFSNRRDANAALAKIRGLGYEAWQN